MVYSFSFEYTKESLASRIFRTVAHDTRNSFVMSTNRLVTTLGVDNLIIVDTPDALLVADKSRIQDVKKIVSEIKDKGRNETFQHREVYRLWGKYDPIDLGERYQVKRITVKPGARLSLQKHHHRAEHRIVVVAPHGSQKAKTPFWSLKTSPPTSL